MLPKDISSDAIAQKLLSNTVKLSSVNQKNFDAIFYPGGHGPMWDLASDKNSIALIKSFYNSQQTNCICLPRFSSFSKCQIEQWGYLIAGKNITSFCNTEEEAVQLTKVVPFSLEDKLKSRGAIYKKGADWSSYVLEDGLLLTGQNPQSSNEVAQKLFDKIKK